MKFHITDSASRRISTLINRDGNIKIALRISVDGGGCSGFKYNYELVETINSDDLIFTQNDVKVIIDQISFEFLNDCIVDFVEELGANYFQITNPNATGKCGCGSSFSV